MITPEIVRSCVRITGLCAVVWPTLYFLNKNGGNLAVNPNGGKLAVSMNVTKQAVEDAMKPRFDDIVRRIDDGLVKIDVDIRGLKKDFKKWRKDLDYVHGLATSTRIELDLLMKKQRVPPFTDDERHKHIEEMKMAGKIGSSDDDDDD
jgi:hypothetical protein